MEETSIMPSVMLTHDIKSLIDLWPSRRALAAEVNALLPSGVRTVTPDQVHKWAANGAIRSQYQQFVLLAGISRGFPITADAMIKLHAAKLSSGATT